MFNAISTFLYRFFLIAYGYGSTYGILSPLGKKRCSSMTNVLS